MWWKVFFLGVAVSSLIATGQPQAAQEQEVTITGREIADRLARLEERVTRVEEGQKRLEQRIDKLEASLNQRIDDLRQIILWGFGLTFTGMFALVGFVIWDRRTAIAPVTRRVNELEGDYKKFKEAILELSKENPRSAEILRKLGIL